MVMMTTVMTMKIDGDQDDDHHVFSNRHLFHYFYNIGQLQRNVSL